MTSTWWSRWEAMVQGVTWLKQTDKPTPEETKREEILASIEQARQEWYDAANYFNNVIDPELVDHAILVRKAAERKYMYLLKQARLQGLRVPVIPGEGRWRGISGDNELT